MRKWLKQLFREMSEQYPVVVNVAPTPVTVTPTAVTVTPAPVHFDHVAVAAELSRHIKIEAPPAPEPVVDVDKLLAGVAEQLYQVMDKKLVDTVNAALAPRLPDQTLEQRPGNPTTEGKLLSLLPSDIQKAARFGCRHVMQESRYPIGGRALGHNWHRDEACERAMTWLQERCIVYHSSDVHLACELYYRVYIRKVE